MSLLLTTILSSSIILNNNNNQTQQHTKSDLLDAICQVESGCDSDAVGDGGDSIGAYQIQYAYWFDAVQFDPSIGGVYKDVLNKDYSRKVIFAYWDRYATKKRLGHEPTLEDLARIHNGGPNGCKKNATVIYWVKVDKVLNNNNNEGE